MAKEKPTYAGDLDTGGKVMKYYGHGSEHELPDWAKGESPTAVALEGLGAAVDVKANTERGLGDVADSVGRNGRRATSRREALKAARTTRDIFGSAELREYYLNAIKEAMEKMDGDKLHDFIMAHRKYAKGDQEQWNEDMVQLLGFNIGEQKMDRSTDDTLINRRVVAALQEYLASSYVNEIFQRTQKVINPWIFVDGKCGPYVLSVLVAFWTAKFSKTSKKTPNPPLDSELGEGYDETGTDAQTYAEALAYKDAKVRSGGQGQKVETKDDPDTSTPEKSKPSRDKDGAAKALYAKLDRLGGSPDLASLVVEYTFNENKPNLSTALAEAFGETVGKGEKASAAPNTFRVLHLLALKIGAKVDEKNTIKEGDTLKITEDGKLTVIASDGKTLRYEETLEESVST